MLKYAFVRDKETGMCQVGDGTNFKFYQEIGMTLEDVTLSDINNEWYLTSKCPMRSDEDKLALLKEDITLNVLSPARKEAAFNEVTFDYNGEEICVSTKKEDMGLIQLVLSQLSLGVIKDVKNWRCKYKSTGYPLYIDFTSLQFRKLTAFINDRIERTYIVEREFLKVIDALTIEDLVNHKKITDLKEKICGTYLKIPNKLEGLFE